MWIGAFASFGQTEYPLAGVFKLLPCHTTSMKWVQRRPAVPGSQPVRESEYAPQRIFISSGSGKISYHRVTGETSARSLSSPPPSASLTVLPKTRECDELLIRGRSQSSRTKLS